MSWIVVFLDKKVEGAMSALPPDMRAHFARIVELIESHGLESVREPYVKHLQGRVWELRIKGRDGIARAAYVTTSGKRIVVIHVFTKKSQKTPRHDLDIALRRAKEVP